MTKFGRQPFMDMIITRGVTMRQVATEIKVPFLHLRHAGYGYVVPKYELRDRIARYFGLPVERLFTAEALAARPSYGKRARSLMTDAERR